MVPASRWLSESRVRDGHQARYEILCNASLHRDGNGNILVVFATVHDISKRVHAQKNLAEQHARELKRLAGLERSQRLTVGRELTVIELTKQTR